MPFSRPTLQDLRIQVAGDINTNLAGADGLLRWSNLRVVGEILAGLANLHYGYEDWISLQAVPFTAEQEFLEGWGALKGVIRKPSVAANGGTTVTGVANTDIPQGTPLVRSDGVIFNSTADVVIGSGGSIEVPAICTTLGAIGNTDAGSTMTLGQGIIGVNSNGVVTTAFTGGADVENDDDFRARVMERYASPPQGGSLQDYITWALEVPGVTRAWSARLGSGMVVVYTMWDISEAAHGGFPQGTNGVATLETRDTPATGDQLIVANYIYNIQPVTPLVYSVAPIADPKNFTITNLNPNTTAMKASISAAFVDLFLRLGQPGGTIAAADMNAAIDAIPGIIDFVIAPNADIVSATGYIPTLGVITYA